MKKCCENFRYQFSQFKVVYDYEKASRSLAESSGAAATFAADRVEYKSLETYRKAFQDRVRGQEVSG